MYGIVTPKDKALAGQVLGNERERIEVLEVLNDGTVRLASGEAKLDDLKAWMRRVNARVLTEDDLDANAIVDRAPCQWTGTDESRTCFVCGTGYNRRRSPMPPCGAASRIQTLQNALRQAWVRSGNEAPDPVSRAQVKPVRRDRRPAAATVGHSLFGEPDR